MSSILNDTRHMVNVVKVLILLLFHVHLKIFSYGLNEQTANHMNQSEH
jgi:hypothetical protein